LLDIADEEEFKAEMKKMGVIRVNPGSNSNHQQ